MMLLLSGVHSECLMQQRRNTLSDYVTVVGGSLRMPGAATKEARFQMILLLLGFTPNAWCSNEGSTLSDDITVVGGSLRMPGAATKEHAFR